MHINQYLETSAVSNKKIISSIKLLLYIDKQSFGTL